MKLWLLIFNYKFSLLLDTSLGACSAASHVTIGDHAYGHIAIGRIVDGVKTIIDTSPSRDFNMMNAEDVRQLINSEYPNLRAFITHFLTSVFRY